MPQRPSVVVFDVNETLPDLSPLADRFADLGVPRLAGHVLFCRVSSLVWPMAGLGGAAHCGGMALDASFAQSRELGLAAVAHLSRYRGTSRKHTESDLRVIFGWCQDRQLAPLAAQRHDLELYLRWLQDVRRFKPSTVSRRLSVVAGFYRTCVIDGVLEHSPAAYVRRPTVPPESPTLGLTHLQFEAMLTAARQSSNPFDFALVCLLGLLGLRIFETVGADIDDLGEEHGHRVLRVRGKGGKVVLVPLPPAVSRAVDRAAGERSMGPLLLNRRGVRMDRHAATRRLRHVAADAGVRLPRMHPHMLRHTFVTTMLDAGVDLPDVQIAARHADARTTMRYDRARKNLDRHPNYILAAYTPSGTRPRVSRTGCWVAARDAAVDPSRRRGTVIPWSSATERYLRRS